jgi:tetratricopeptide (TPR) repeat protein
VRLGLRDPSKTALCHSMIGVIYEKQGKVSEAIESYKAGLHAERITPDEELALLYQLAFAWEHRNNKQEAVYYLKRIVAQNPNYRDARQRLQSLESAEKGSGTRRRDNIDEDLDAAFDEVMKKPKGK